MKRIGLYLLSILIVLSFSGCLGTLSLAATAISVVTTSQEVEEEYDGDFADYVEDKVETTYEYIEEKVTEE